MQNNKLRMAIRATAAVTVLGLASQAQAFSFSAGDVDASLYGYARLNASYDMNADISDITRSGTFSAIEDTDEEGHFGASAAQSRLGLTTVHKSGVKINRSEEHTSELQSRPHLVCRLLLEKKKTQKQQPHRMTHVYDTYTV